MATFVIDEIVQRIQNQVIVVVIVVETDPVLISMAATVSTGVSAAINEGRLGGCITVLSKDSKVFRRESSLEVRGGRVVPTF